VVPEQKVKQPMHMRLKDGGLFGLAGLYTPGDEPTAAIITTAPNELMVPIHNRMPAILLPALEASWLQAGLADPDELLSLLDRTRPTPCWPRLFQPRSISRDAKVPS